MLLQWLVISSMTSFKFPYICEQSLTFGLFSICLNVMNLKVANLSLYAVAFVVFNVVGAGTPAAVENQVCDFSVTLFILLLSFGCVLITF